MIDVAIEGRASSFVATRPRASASPRRLDVLLLDGETRQTLTSTRALGRSGLKVGVAGAQRDEAPAMHSRWCNTSVLLPPLDTSPRDYADALLRFLDENPTSVVVPAYDGSIEVLRERRNEIEQRTAVALAAEGALAVAIDKEKTLALARHLDIRTPRAALVATDLDLEQAVSEVGLPAVMKPLRSWSMTALGGVRLGSLPVSTFDQARRALELITRQGGEATLQEWLSGRRDAVTLFLDRSEVRACFAQTSHRELPRLGGVSVLCESIPPLDDITAPAQQLVAEMGVEGCSMVEFRRDSSGRPVLMEVNPRLSGSVELAVACGVNFPRLTYDWALQRPVPKIDGYRVGVRMRWLSGDLRSLYSALHHDQGPDVPTPRAAWREFFHDSLRRDHPATFDVADPMPSLIEARAHVLRPLAQRIHKMSKARRNGQTGHDGSTH